jgi:hypothetical protein
MLDRVEYITTRYCNIARKMPQIESAFFNDTVGTLVRYWHHSKNMPTAQKRIRKWVRKHTGRILTCKLPLRSRLACLYRFYLKKPAVVSEPNPIKLDAEEYFD